MDESTTHQKFLAFFLNQKYYAFPILKVNEVIVMPEIVPVPKSPYSMKGVINLRGQIIPIIDLRTALNLNETEYNQETCVIITRFSSESDNTKLIGFIVDSVSEVFEAENTQIEKAPDYGQGSDNGFLYGMAKIKDRIIMLLDIDNILSLEGCGVSILNNFEDNISEEDLTTMF